MKTKRKFGKVKRRTRKVTLEDVVKAAHSLGMTVTQKLVPIEVVSGGSVTVSTVTNDAPTVNFPLSQWPGDPPSRYAIADLNYTDKDVKKAFRDDPSVKWVITPYQTYERESFLESTTTTKKENK